MFVYIYAGEAMVPLISDQLGGSSGKAPESSGYNPVPSSMQQPPAYPQSDPQPSDIPYTVYQQPVTVTQTQVFEKQWSDFLVRI